VVPCWFCATFNDGFFANRFAETTPGVRRTGWDATGLWADRSGARQRGPATTDGDPDRVGTDHGHKTERARLDADLAQEGCRSDQRPTTYVIIVVVVIFI
jgi:hypothetical protein